MTLSNPKSASRKHLPILFLFALILSLLLSPLKATTTLALAADIKQPETGQGDYGLNTGSAGIATADPDGPHSTYDWPFEWDQMGHLLSSYQGYGSLDSAYFHHGIDMVSNQPNVPVYTRSGGQVVNVENYNTPPALYWEVAILDPEGYVWQYHHVDRESIPQSIFDAWNAYRANPATGGFVEANTFIGNVVNWPVETFGYFFHHIHLNILAAGDIYLNPLEFHNPGNKPDTQDPVIHEIGLFTGYTLLPGNSIDSDTQYSLYLNASDLYQSQVFKLAPHTIAFKIDGAEEWTTMWEFRKMPGGSNEKAFVNDLYIRNHTKGNYEARDFYFDLGFTTDGQREFPKDAGQHTIEVRITDFAGNSTQDSYTWYVTEKIKDNVCANRQGISKTFSFASRRLIEDIDFKLMLAHEQRGDVWVSLKGPGDPIPTYLIKPNADNNKNYNVTINDSIEEPLHNGQDDDLSAPVFGRLAGPTRDGNLESFFGREAKGDWTVFICDNQSGKTGELYFLELELHLSANSAPIANQQNLKTAYLRPVSIRLSGSDPDQDPISYEVKQMPTHGTLTGTAPNLVYTPDAGFSGEDFFTFVVSDGDLDSEPAKVSIHTLPALFFPISINAD
jgi:subtilisin-like proprotein convertase family protein